MGMNYFLAVVSRAQIDEIAARPERADAILESLPEGQRSDVDTAWDALRAILGGVGFERGDFLPDALYNGCFLVSPEDARAESEKLAAVDRDGLPAAVAALGGQDIYHLESWSEDPEMLLEQFDKLRALYRKAAELGHGVVHYAA